MSDSRIIELLAKNIASNASLIAERPNDWPDNLRQRADAVMRDASELWELIMRDIAGGGSR